MSNYRDFPDTPGSPARSARIITPSATPLNDLKGVRTITSGDLVLRGIADTSDVTLPNCPADYLINLLVDRVNTGTTAIVLGYFAAPVLPTPSPGMQFVTVMINGSPEFVTFNNGADFVETAA